MNKLQKILLFLFGVIAFFPVTIFLSGFLSNMPYFFGFSPLISFIIWLVFLVFFIDLILFAIVKALRTNRNKPAFVIFVIYLLLAYTLVFSIVPTPTFCRAYSSDKMTCGESVLVLKNWENNSLHLEWNYVKNWLVGEQRVKIQIEK